jgi:hypothetical protein
MMAAVPGVRQTAWAPAARISKARQGLERRAAVPAGMLRSMTIDAVALWLFVVNLGVVFGAGVYEQRIVAPRWLERGPTGPARWHAAAARADDVGRRFWGLAATLPFTLLTLTSVVLAWGARDEARAWWLAAGVLAALERLATAGYFIPVMVRLMRAADTPQTVTTAVRWSRLNLLRHGVVLVAWLAALRAFELAARIRPGG